MKQLTLVVFIFLISGTNGFFGISSFFDGSRRSIEDTARVIREQTTAVVHTLQKDLVPEIKQMLTGLRESVGEIVNQTQKLELRLEEFLDRIDEHLKKIFQRVDHIVDIIITVLCLGLFCVVSMMTNHFKDTFINEYLHLLRFIALITSVAVFLRMTFNYFFKEEVLSPADTVKYFVVCPALLVGIWNLIKLLCFILCLVWNVVCYFLMLPGVCVYVTVAGPIIWIKGAHQYSKISKSNTAFYMTISLPWSSAAFCLMAFNVATTIKPGEDFLAAAFYFALAATYIYFYINAVFLKINYQRPAPQDKLREIYGDCRSQQNAITFKHK